MGFYEAECDGCGERCMPTMLTDISYDCMMVCPDCIHDMESDDR